MNNYEKCMPDLFFTLPELKTCQNDAFLTFLMIVFWIFRKIEKCRNFINFLECSKDHFPLLKSGFWRDFDVFSFCFSAHHELSSFTWSSENTVRMVKIEHFPDKVCQTFFVIHIKKYSYFVNIFSARRRKSFSCLHQKEESSSQKEFSTWTKNFLKNH